MSIEPPPTSLINQILWKSIVLCQILQILMPQSPTTQ